MKKDAPVTGTMNAARQGSGGRQRRSPWGSWCGRVGRQFTRSSPLKRKPVGPHFQRTEADRTILSRLKLTNQL